jgi:hypothetical protein
MLSRDEVPAIFDFRADVEHRAIMLKSLCGFLTGLSIISLLAGCRGVAAPPTSTVTAAATATPVPVLPTQPPASVAVSPTPEATETEAPVPTPTIVPAPNFVILGHAAKISQLVGEIDRETNQPTLNQTLSRYKLWATDLGIPFRHQDRTFLLFGDSGGAHGGDAIAYTTDSNPEDGVALTFLTQTDGSFKAIHIPGISQEPFEVPTEGTSLGGNMYVYHTTDSTGPGEMGRTVVAVSTDLGESFQYLYDLSIQHFIQVSVVEVDAAEWPGLPQSAGEGLVMFGAGEYRESDVRLAFQPADQIETPESLLYFTGLDAGGQPAWSPQEIDALPLFNQPCVGELSVTFNRFIGQWLMLYNCHLEPRGINVRVAAHPWGPWSPPQVIFDPVQDRGFCHFIHRSWTIENCDALSDPGQEETNGGAYGPYQLEDLAIGDAAQTTIYFTLSTWNPYTVVLMKATLGKGRP